VTKLEAAAPRSVLKKLSGGRQLAAAKAVRKLLSDCYPQSEARV